MLKVVVDTNVFISALLIPGGTPGLVVAAAFDRRYELIASPRLIDEIRGVLQRPKIASRIPAASIADFLEAVEGVASIAADTADPPRSTADVGDDYLVALAIGAGADMLVTGDLGLIEAPGPAMVVTPRAFLEALAEEP